MLYYLPSFIMKLYYIANYRLPTRKAHGLQITKMCEAFAGAGLNCELVVPKRYKDPTVVENDILKFYGVKTPFGIKYLPSFDFVRFGALPVLGRITFWIQQFSFACRLKNYIKDDNAVIYSRDQFSIHALRAKKNKLFWEIHNIPRNIGSSFYKTVLARVDGIIVISGALKKEIAKYYNGPILIAPDAVDWAEFDIDITKNRARELLDLPQDKKVAIYTGQLYEWKGVDNLIKSVEFLPSNILILIVGGLKEDSKKLIESIPTSFEKNIKFIEQVSHDKIPIFLKAADCAVLTGQKTSAISEKYTSPLKLFEYMAAKCPIVAQNLPSFGEILSGENAVLVEPENPRALAEGINSILGDENLAKRISQNAFQKVLDYTWNKRAANISRLFT